MAENPQHQREGVPSLPQAMYCQHGNEYEASEASANQP